MDAAGRVKALYNKRMDAAIWYVKNLNLPKETQEKVRTWFIYNWQQQKILGIKGYSYQLHGEKYMSVLMHDLIVQKHGVKKIFLLCYSIYQVRPMYLPNLSFCVPLY